VGGGGEHMCRSTFLVKSTFCTVKKFCLPTVDLPKNMETLVEPVYRSLKETTYSLRLRGFPGHGFASMCFFC